MDPEQAYQDWRDAIDRNDREAAWEASNALLGWLRQGGFQPRWTEAQAASFFSWHKEVSESLYQDVQIQQRQAIAEDFLRVVDRAIRDGYSQAAIKAKLQQVREQVGDEVFEAAVARVKAERERQRHIEQAVRSVGIPMDRFLGWAKKNGVGDQRIVDKMRDELRKLKQTN
jgi:hypothetical protein